MVLDIVEQIDMDMINKELIEEVCNPETQEDRLFDNVMDFKAGIEWTESQMKQLMIDFGEYCIINQDEATKFTSFTVTGFVNHKDHYIVNNLFEQFLKERD